MPNLTKRFIDGLAPPARVTIYWDSGLPGFGLRHFPSGVRTFVLDYRDADKRKRRVNIGRFGPLTVDEARSQARALAGRVAKGESPAADRDARRSAPSVAQLLDDYLSRHVAVANAPRTRESATWMVEKHLRPALGALKVASVTRQDVLRLRKRLEDTPRLANLATAVLSKAFSLAEEWGWRDEGRNPCRHIRRFDEVERERFLSNDELARLGAAIVEAETVGIPWRERDGAKAKHRPSAENRRTLVNTAAIAAIKLLLFTGARRAEVLELKWEHVDFERETIRLPARKGGARREHPASSWAFAVLATLPKVEGSPWVLRSPTDPAKPLSASVLSNAWQVLRLRAKLSDVRIHDLRHTAGTFVSQAGANAFNVRDFLRHKTLAMTSRYVNHDADPLRALAETVGERVAGGLARGASGDVLPFKRKL